MTEPTRIQLETLHLLSDGDPKHQDKLDATPTDLAEMTVLGWITRVETIGAVWITDEGRRIFLLHVV